MAADPPDGAPASVEELGAGKAMQPALPGSEPDGRGAASSLEPAVQEHLGKQLRSTYHVMTEKPTFLGDPVIPPQFDGLIQKLEARDRERTEAIHDRAVAAVEEALGAKPKDKQ